MHVLIATVELELELDGSLLPRPVINRQLKTREYKPPAFQQTGVYWPLILVIFIFIFCRRPGPPPAASSSRLTGKPNFQIISCYVFTNLIHHSRAASLSEFFFIFNPVFGRSVLIFYHSFLNFIIFYSIPLILLCLALSRYLAAILNTLLGRMLVHVLVTRRSRIIPPTVKCYVLYSRGYN